MTLSQQVERAKAMIATWPKEKQEAVKADLVSMNEDLRQRQEARQNMFRPCGEV